MDKKDTFYFSHDYNPRSDQKIKKLLMKHGMIGYGVYWALIEDLYNNANAMRTHYEGIAYDLRISPELAESVINDFELFRVKDQFFHSPSVQKRLQERAEKSENAKKSANKRWSKNETNANAMRTQCERNAIKERKGKERKYIKDIPTLWIATLGRNPLESESEETQRLIDKFGMDKVYQAYKKASLHRFKNLPNIIKHINDKGEFVLEDDNKIISSERFDKPIVRLN